MTMEETGQGKFVKQKPFSVQFPFESVSPHLPPYRFLGRFEIDTHFSVLFILPFLPLGCKCGIYYKEKSRS